MAAVLTEAEVRSFHDRGFASPVRLMSEAEAENCRSQLETYEADTGKSAVETVHIKGHLYFDWAWKLARHPRLAGADRSFQAPAACHPACRGPGQHRHYVPHGLRRA